MFEGLPPAPAHVLAASNVVLVQRCNGMARVGQTKHATQYVVAEARAVHPTFGFCPRGDPTTTAHVCKPSVLSAPSRSLLCIGASPWRRRELGGRQHIELSCRSFHRFCGICRAVMICRHHRITLLFPGNMRSRAVGPCSSKLSSRELPLPPLERVARTRHASILYVYLGVRCKRWR